MGILCDLYDFSDSQLTETVQKIAARLACNGMESGLFWPNLRELLEAMQDVENEGLFTQHAFRRIADSVLSSIGEGFSIHQEAEKLRAVGLVATAIEIKFFGRERLAAKLLATAFEAHEQAEISLTAEYAAESMAAVEPSAN